MKYIVRVHLPFLFFLTLFQISLFAGAQDKSFLKGRRNKEFNAPVIYSLSKPPSAVQRKTTDMGAAKMAAGDSLTLAKRNLLLKAQSDSLYLSQYSLSNSDVSVRNQLSAITNELKEIKNLLRSQQLRPRYQQLQYQQDSIKALRNGILLQKNLSPEDQLRLRIYDLQTDSVKNIIERLQTTDRHQAEGTDSSGMYMRPQDISEPEGGQEKSSDENLTTGKTGAEQEPLSGEALKTYHDEIRLLKQDKRYKSDTAFKRNVDALQQKLKVYEQSGSTQAQQLPLPSTIIRDTILNQPDQHKIDSLQHKLDNLQRAIASGDSTSQRKDTVLQNEVIRDTAAFNQSVSRLQTSLKQNADSVALMQAQLKHSGDSAAYYRRVQFAAGTADTQNSPSKKKRWYQHIFGTGNKKKNTAAQNAAATNDDYTARQKYYTENTNRLQQRIDDLERRNKELQNNYQTLISQSGRRTYQSSTPVISYERDNNRDRNYNEINALRNELDSLKSQVRESNQRNDRNNRSDSARQQNAETNLQAAVTSDTLHVTSLQSEIEQLRAELNTLRTSKNTPATAVQKPDVTGFPVVSVYFKFGAVTLANDQVNRIVPFTRVALKNENAGIVLKGFTDAVGKPEKNKVIARKRTEYVKKLLASKYNIDESRITLADPEVMEADKSGKPNPLDRRVDLTFE